MHHVRPSREPASGSQRTISCCWLILFLIAFISSLPSIAPGMVIFSASKSSSTFFERRHTSLCFGHADFYRNQMGETNQRMLFSRQKWQRVIIPFDCCCYCADLCTYLAFLRTVVFLVASFAPKKFPPRRRIGHSLAPTANFQLSRFRARNRIIIITIASFLAIVRHC